MSVKRATDIIQASPHFVVPSIALARRAAIGELSAGSEELVELTKAQEEILAKAVECQQKALDAMLSYWELCMLLRKHGMGPKEMRTLLFAAGFGKVRVSEILTVVGSSDRVFNDYALRAIGFKLALAHARADKQSSGEVLLLPQDMQPAIVPIIAKVLGDKKRAVIEVDGVKITFARSKPSSVVQSAPVEPEVKNQRVARSAARKSEAAEAASKKKGK